RRRSSRESPSPVCAADRRNRGSTGSTMPAEKIAIIGGGSAYVPGVLYSLATSGEALAGSEIALMDIDPARLPMMTRIGQRMAAEAGVALTVTETTDLRKALHDATFVLTNFRP